MSDQHIPNFDQLDFPLEEEALARAKEAVQSDNQDERAGVIDGLESMGLVKKAVELETRVREEFADEAELEGQQELPFVAPTQTADSQSRRKFAPKATTDFKDIPEEPGGVHEEGSVGQKLDSKRLKDIQKAPGRQSAAQAQQLLKDKGAGKGSILDRKPLPEAMKQWNRRTQAQAPDQRVEAERRAQKSR